MTLALGVDIAAALLLATLCIRGYLRGFSGEIISLAATIGGFLLAWKLSPLVAAFILEYFELNPALVQIAALVGIYVVVLLAGAWICRMVQAFLKFTNLSHMDRTLGMAAGAVKTYVVLMVVYLGVLAFSPMVSTYWMQESISMRTVGFTWPFVRGGLSTIKTIDPENTPWLEALPAEKEEAPKGEAPAVEM